jgi:uncharacterized protein (TIGR00251 family)
MVDELFEILAPDKPAKRPRAKTGSDSKTGSEAKTVSKAKKDSAKSQDGEAAVDEAARASVVVHVHVQPGAGRTAVVGRHGDAVKVRVAAPPEGGRANDACVKLLADTFGVPASAVTLVSGPSSRIKRFRLDDVDVAEFRRLLSDVVEGSGAPGGPAAGGSVGRGMRSARPRL